MYINFKMLQSRGLSVNQLMVLQMCKQNKNEDLSYFLNFYGDFDLQFLEEQKLVKHVKVKNKQETAYHTARISDKGNDLLNDLETPEVLEEDLQVFEWVKNLYLKLGKEVGNQKRSKINLALFRTQSGIEKNALCYLIQEFVKDEDEMEYSKVLQYLIHKPANAFSTRFDLEESRLYRYYCKHQEKFDKLFEEL